MPKQLNTLKIMEMVVDFRDNSASFGPHHPVWLPSGHCGILLLPLRHHHPPQVGAQQQLPHQQGTAEDVRTSCSSWRSWRCQSRWWYTSTPPSMNPSSLPPSPSVTMLPLPRTRADCRLSFALLIGWQATTYCLLKICKHPGHSGEQEGSWLTPITLDINFFKNFPQQEMFYLSFISYLLMHHYI